MDDREKAAIRKKATWRMWRSVIGCLIMAALLFRIGKIDMGEVQKVERRLGLSSKPGMVLFEQIRYSTQRGEQLAFFPPPEDAAARDAWAAQIESHFGHPVAVFINDDTASTWVRDPFSPAAREEAARQVSPAAQPSHPDTLKSFGARYLRFGGFTAGRQGYQWCMAGDRSNGQVWGAVMRTDDEWLAFFRDLQTPRGKKLDFGGPAWMLDNTFSLPCSDARDYLVGMRAFLHDSLIFASPDLKVSEDSLQETFVHGPRMEFFTAPKDFSYRKQQWLGNLILLPLSLFPLILIIPFYRWYRTVRKLTEPDEPKST